MAVNERALANSSRLQSLKSDAVAWHEESIPMALSIVVPPVLGVCIKTVHGPCPEVVQFGSDTNLIIRRHEHLGVM